MALKVEQEEVRLEVAPKVYVADDTHLFLNWIAEGTDGVLYVVPSEPGGWRRRGPFTGEITTLKAVSPQKARAIVGFVGGGCTEWGSVVVAESLYTESTPFWSSESLAASV